MSHSQDNSFCLFFNLPITGFWIIFYHLQKINITKSKSKLFLTTYFLWKQSFEKHKQNNVCLYTCKIYIPTSRFHIPSHVERTCKFWNTYFYWEGEYFEHMSGKSSKFRKCKRPLLTTNRECLKLKLQCFVSRSLSFFYTLSFFSFERTFSFAHITTITTTK